MSSGSNESLELMQSARDVLTTLMRRCVECPNQAPSCPSCPNGQTCSLIPASCDACASTVCVKTSEFQGQISEAPTSTPIGPIIGGVIGGLIAMAVLGFCVWYFCFRTKRRKDTWDPPEKRDQSTLARGVGSRTHSIASTVLTRASNVIQIAYIPGVTGRSPPVSPSVPPMPGFSGQNTANSTPQPDTHFFMADDLRNSTWSDNSVDHRISLAPSLARASQISTIGYGDAPPMPAMRAQAAMVNVKQGSSSSTPARSSPLISGTVVGPQMVKPVNIQNSSIVARNVTAKPIEVKKSGSANRVPTLGNLARQGSTKSGATTIGTEATGPVFEEKEVLVSPRTPGAVLTTASPISPPSALRSQPSEMSLGAISAVLPTDGPLSRPESIRPDSGGLTAMIEAAIMSASANGRHSPSSAATGRPEAQRADSSPFSDIHELPSGTP